MAHDDCVEGMGGEVLLHFFGHFPIGPIYGRMIGKLTVGLAQGIYCSKQLGRALYQSGIAAANLLCQFFAHQQIGVHKGDAVASAPHFIGYCLGGRIVAAAKSILICGRPPLLRSWICADRFTLPYPSMVILAVWPEIRPGSRSTRIWWIRPGVWRITKLLKRDPMGQRERFPVRSHGIFYILKVVLR